MTSQCEWLLADIGGTNARFALASGTHIERSKTYQTRSYPDLIDAISAFLKEECAGIKPTMAALAVAGPVIGNVVRLTNVDWVCDKKKILKTFGLTHVEVINDFEAVAYALNRLEPTDVVVLQQGEKSLTHPMLVMGPGTGLGIAALVPYEGGFKAIATEAGHTRYAPANTRETQMVSIIAREHQLVTAETLISGPGLVRIYTALCDMSDRLDLTEDPLEPADVVERARTGDSIAKETLDQFAAVFGSFASQMALSYNALGGVCLAGGVLKKINQEFDEESFLRRFATNPKMAGLLRRIPVIRVNADIPAFNGLQWLLGQKTKMAAGKAA